MVNGLQRKPASPGTGGAPARREPAATRRRAGRRPRSHCRSAKQATGATLNLRAKCRVDPATRLEWQSPARVAPRIRDYSLACDGQRSSRLQFDIPVEIIAPAIVQIIGRERAAVFLQLPRRRTDRLAVRV